jgi:beta-glucosidase
MARGATWDPSLEARVGDVMGVEARAQGANLLGSVCVNALRHPAWGRAQETYGEDPLHLGAMGASLTKGIQRHVMACVKHFACNSIEDNRYAVDVRVDAQTLHEVYLPHFKDCVDAGAAAVMSAYNKVNGAYCGESAPLLTEVLRDRWGFEGFVVSDFLFGLRDGARAMRAGMDLEMPFRNRFARDLPRAMAEGTLDPARLDEAVLRLVGQQLRFADIGEPGRYERSAVACDAHRTLAREVAARSMVLLQNDPVRGAALLPLDARALRRVAVIGRLAAEPTLGDRGSSAVRPPSVVTALDGLREALPTAKVTHDDGRDPRRAADAARDADVAVVVVGLTWRDEGEHVAPTPDLDLLRVLQPPPLRELPALARALRSATGMHSAGDRRHLGLRPEDVTLLRAVAKANDATVVVLIGGSALDLSAWRRCVPAVVMAWYPGMEGGHALADLLLGRVEPRGRLPSAWADDPSWLPTFEPKARAVTYGALHGQRWLEAHGRRTSTPLGFGLNYTRLALGAPRVARRGDEIELHAPVRNEGGRAGDALVMVRATVEGDAAPSRLVGFARCEVASGAEDVARVVIPRARLQRFVPEKGGWALPKARVHFAVEGAPGGVTVDVG